MATLKTKIPQALWGRITSLESDLRTFLEEQREALEAKSDKFQESDKGTNIGAWIDEIEAAADALEQLTEAAPE
jgi:hypothetical protein